MRRERVRLFFPFIARYLDTISMILKGPLQRKSLSQKDVFRQKSVSCRRIYGCFLYKILARVNTGLYLKYIMRSHETLAHAG
jgi:hypothetical protein